MDYPEPAPASWAESIDGRTAVTSALLEPLDVRAVSADRRYTIRYYVADSFRWEDQGSAGYAEGAWDLRASPPDVEPVRRFGANAYEVY